MSPSPPLLCNTFRDQAALVWNRSRRAAGLGLQLSEETLTELLLLKIAHKHAASEIDVIAATKPQESKHGADWEWHFKRGEKTIKFRVQAKRLFPNGCYQSLNKRGQRKKLVEAAIADGFTPLYCLYNSPIGIPDTGALTHLQCRHNYVRRSYWGCSIATPNQVVRARSNRFEKLHPFTEPWHFLVCRAPGANFLASIKGQYEKWASRPPRPSRPPDEGVSVSRLPPKVAQLALPSDGDRSGRRRASPERPELDEITVTNTSGYVIELAERSRAVRDAAGSSDQTRDNLLFNQDLLKTRNLAGIAVFEDVSGATDRQGDG